MSIYVNDPGITVVVRLSSTLVDLSDVVEPELQVLFSDGTSKTLTTGVTITQQSASVCTVQYITQQGDLDVQGHAVFTPRVKKPIESFKRRFSPFHDTIQPEEG